MEGFAQWLEGRTARGCVTVAIGTVFFWWPQRLLLGGRVAWTALLPGAVATMLGLLGPRVFSRLASAPRLPRTTSSSVIRAGYMGSMVPLPRPFSCSLFSRM
ncbi:hypothetical protein OTB20_22375 [Streptomyces sp. H27-H1]|uniref:hypothetical protein n=1 Tax=Streptomyces sp. H27-H1 TaxID=2996461 RepID=UPI00226E21B0|nr:hypothetical protein [Streptomyces sp. H27-H1]MCY0928907.1 hypothetical protein [Streptomyces sp. H27-H1]